MLFDGKCLKASAFLAGLSFFLLVLHYYVLGHISAVEGNAKLFGVILPMVLLGLYMVLVRLIRLPVAPVYGGIALLYCLCLVLAGANGGPAWLNLAAPIFYVLACIVLMLSLLGFFPGKWWLALAFLIAFGMRFWFRDFLGYFEPLRLAQAMPEAGWLCGVLSICFLCLGTKAKPLKKKSAEKV